MTHYSLRWKALLVPLPYNWTRRVDVQEALVDRCGSFDVHFASDMYPAGLYVPPFRPFSSRDGDIPFGILFRSRANPELATWLTLDPLNQSAHVGFDLMAPNGDTLVEFDQRENAWNDFYDCVAGKLMREKKSIEEIIILVSSLHRELLNGSREAKSD